MRFALGPLLLGGLLLAAPASAQFRGGMSGMHARSGSGFGRMGPGRSGFSGRRAMGARGFSRFGRGVEFNRRHEFFDNRFRDHRFFDRRFSDHRFFDHRFAEHRFFDHRFFRHRFFHGPFFFDDGFFGFPIFPFDSCGFVSPVPSVDAFGFCPPAERVFVERDVIASPRDEEREYARPRVRRHEPEFQKKEPGDNEKGESLREPASPRRPADDFYLTRLTARNR